MKQVAHILLLLAASASLAAHAAAPIANAGPDHILADYDGNHSVTVQLDASASTDVDGDIVSYEWSWDGGSASGRSSEGTFPATNTPVTVTLTVTDEELNSSTDTLVVTTYQREAALFTDFPLKVDWWGAHATLAGETLVMTSAAGLDAVYRRNAGLWSETPVSYTAGGNHIAVDEDTIFGGFFYDGSLLKSLRYDGNAWNQTPLSYPDPILPWGGFSFNFAVDPETVVVSDSTGNSFAGRVLVYDWVGNNLTLASEVLPSAGFTPGFSLGKKIAIKGDLMVATSTATYGDQLHVFRKTSGSWNFETTLTADILRSWPGRELEANYFKDYDLSIANGKILVARYDPFQMVVIEKIGANWVQTPIASNAFGTPREDVLSYAYNFYDDRFSYRMNDDGKSFVVGDQDGRFFLFQNDGSANWAGSPVTSRRLLTSDLSDTSDTRVTGFSSGLIVLSDGANHKARVIDTATSIDPINAEPVADAGPDITDTSFDGNPVSVFLDGSGSRDLNYDSPLAAVWTWEGGSATGLQPEVHLPPSVTSVVLTVTDVGGAISRDTIMVNIESAPEIDAGTDVSVVDSDGNGTFRIQVNGTQVSPGNPIVSWVWTWPGGSLNGQSGTISLGASANGKPVTLKVIDSLGLFREDQFIFRISKQNPQPVIVQGSGGRALDYFGQHVSIQNGTSLVSAPGVRVNGETVGATYLSRKINNAWPQSSLAPGTQQGSGVLIDGDTAFVGAAEFDIMAGENVLADKAGRVVIYQRQAGVWNQMGFLSAPVPAAHPIPGFPPDGLLGGHQFGYSMAKSGNWLVIGAVGALAELPGPAFIGEAGLVYLFENLSGTWTLRQTLISPDAEQSGGFGQAVAISGDSLVVTSRQYQGGSNGYGVAHVFTKGPTQWDFTLRLLPDSGGAFSGGLVMDSTEILIAASGEFNGLLPGNSRGQIYRFVKAGTTWTPAGKIIPTVMRGISNGSFGGSMFLRDGILAVGAPLDAEGRVDIWRRDTMGWEFVDDIFITTAIDPRLNISARFGFSVSHDGKDLIVGAPSGNNSSGVSTGKAYIFEDYTALDPDANHEPLADAGPNINVIDTIVRDPVSNAFTEPLGSEWLTLNGSASFDRENAIVSYEWAWPGGSATGVSASARFPVGKTTVMLTVTDNKGVVNTDTVDVTVSLEQTDAASLPGTNNTLTVNLPVPDARWRLTSEFLWHGPGESASHVLLGETYQIEIIAFPGSTETVTTYVTVETQNTIADLSLAEPTRPTQTGVLRFPGTAQGFSWRLTGEPAWRNVAGTGGDIDFVLPVGDYRIEFRPVLGYATPQARLVSVRENLVLGINWGEYLRINNFDAGKTFDVAPSPNLAGDPHQYVGMIRTPLGRGSGTVVAERVVLTAAHLFFDSTGLQWTDVEWFPRQQEGARQAAPATPRGILYRTSYAKLVAPDFVQGTVEDLPNDDQEVDFAVLYFNEPIWTGGSANFLQSGIARNWLTGTENKHALGYPQRSQEYEQRGKMFEKLFSSSLTPLDANPTPKLYETGEVFGDGGASGSALFVQPQGTSAFYPAAILLAGQGRAVYRVIDEDVGRMIKDGQDAASDNDDVLDNNSSIVAYQGLGAFTTLALSSATTAPPSARWSITPNAGLGHSNLKPNQEVVFNTNWASFTVSFTPVSGFTTPPPITYSNTQITRGAKNVLPGAYASPSGYETWKQNKGITNDIDDRDGDGKSALIEYAINGDPDSGSDPAPLRMAATPTQNTHAEYEVFVSSTADKIRYVVKASNTLPQTNVVTLATFTKADGTNGYLRVTDTQPKSASPRRFAWVEYTHDRNLPAAP